MSLISLSLRAQPRPRARLRSLWMRLRRTAFVILGTLIVLLGVLIAPLPGPGGVPVILLGLVIILRNSVKARRRFIRLHQAHPRVISPIRKVLRRNPGFLIAAWRRALRLERQILPRRYRFAVRSRRRFRAA